MLTIHKSKLPPGPKNRLSLGPLFRFQRDSIGFLKKITTEYGDIAFFKIGPVRIALLNHPDFIKEVLTTQHDNFIKGRPLAIAKLFLGDGLLNIEGELHKQHSRIIQPAFHHKMVESYTPAVTEPTRQMMAGWKEGSQVDMMEEMTKVSIAIAAKALFAADLKQEIPEIYQAMQSAMTLFGRVKQPYSEWLLKLPLPSTIRFYRAKASLDNAIDKMLEKRKRQPLDGSDLASLLLLSQRKEGHSGGLSHQQIRDEALTLFLTAFDTTSIALTWTFYLLSQHPEVETRLHEEVDRVLQNRLPTAEDISQLKYTRMVLGESMRLYPPIYLITREAVKDFSIGPYIIPAGTLILISPYLIHRDPRFHPEPEKFNPQAWEERTQSQKSKYEYFPFGGGPRACIGQPFAWLEGVLLLAAVAQSWRAKLLPEHPVELLQLINLRPKHGMMMTLHPR